MLLNPLTDPQPGDVVETADGRRRTVVYFFRGDRVVVVYRQSKYSTTKVCSDKSWRDWCRRNKARVIENAGEEESCTTLAPDAK
jgi:hypothetical protein